MPQTYSLTILTVVADLEINTNLHFQALFRFYLETFSLSKIFIFFGVGEKSCSLFFAVSPNTKVPVNVNVPVLIDSVFAVHFSCLLIGTSI